MSRNRRRRDSNAPRPELSRAQPQKKAQPASSLAGTGIPEWNWRTAPVALMFAAGGIMGTFLGLLGSNQETVLLIPMALFSVIFGLALGRVVRRWLAIRRLERIRAG